MPQSAITWYPDNKETVSWAAREVVRDFEERPHLVVRLELSGVYFAPRAQVPFIRVGKVQSRLVLLDPDGQHARGYFDQPLPDRGQIVFGYGDQVVLVIHDRYRKSALGALDRRRLAKGTRLYERRQRVTDRPR
jgi:hypothetical protein